jgi:hypothetical protein
MYKDWTGENKKRSYKDWNGDFLLNGGKKRKKYREMEATSPKMGCKLHSQTSYDLLSILQKRCEKTGEERLCFVDKKWCTCTEIEILCPMVPHWSFNGLYASNQIKLFYSVKNFLCISSIFNSSLVTVENWTHDVMNFSPNIVKVITSRSLASMSWEILYNHRLVCKNLVFM